MKFHSKNDFMVATEEQWELLWEVVTLAEDNNVEEFQLKRLLAHLYAWHGLLLQWYRIGQTRTPDLPAKGFNWRQTPALNAELDEKFRDIPFANIKRRLKMSHGRVMKLVEQFAEKEFSEPGCFAWTGKQAIASYVVPNTFSHYRWAIRKIKKLQK